MSSDPGPTFDQGSLGHARAVAGGDPIQDRHHPDQRHDHRLQMRETTRRRRRDAVTAMSVALVASLVLGALPALRPMWFVAAFAALALVAYLSLLLRFESNAAERRSKVVALAGSSGRALRPSHYVTEVAQDLWASHEDEDSVVVVSAVGRA